MQVAGQPDDRVGRLEDLRVGPLLDSDITRGVHDNTTHRNLLEYGVAVYRKPGLGRPWESLVKGVLTGHPTRPDAAVPSRAWTTVPRSASSSISRRAKITPQQAGLPDIGTRRVPGLRRGEVAALAGVSIEYYSKLERGSLAGVSASVLDAIARALQLDDAERAHLFHLAHAADGDLFTRSGRQKIMRKTLIQRSVN